MASSKRMSGKFRKVIGVQVDQIMDNFINNYTTL